MRILIVFCHPYEKSNAAGLFDCSRATLQAHGHDLQIIDLHRVRQPGNEMMGNALHEECVILDQTVCLCATRHVRGDPLFAHQCILDSDTSRSTKNSR